MNPPTKEEYAKILTRVDWYYERAEGRTYRQGKATYTNAKNLATTPELKTMFNTALQKNQH